MAALELFLWGVFCSLLCRQPLRAAVLAAIFGTTTIHAIAMMGAHQWRPEIYLEPRTVLPRLGVACILALVNAWLGFRWLRDGGTRADDGRRFGRASTKRKLDSIQSGAVASRSTIVGRLAWQQWRQSSRMMVILVAMTVPLLAFAVVNWDVLFEGHGNSNQRTAGNLPLWVMLALATVPLAGASVFMGDQRRRSFRFLTERGVSSTHLWVARHAVWLLAVLSGRPWLSCLGS